MTCILMEIHKAVNERMVDILDERKLSKGLRKTDSGIENTCITISPLIVLPFLRDKCIYFIANFYGTGNLHFKLTSPLEIVISDMALCFHCVKYDTSLTRIFPYKDKIVILSSHSPGASGEGKPYHF